MVLLCTKLGDLPSFGASRRSGGGRGAARDIDTALGSLLEDSDGDSAGTSGGVGVKLSNSRIAAGGNNSRQVIPKARSVP